MIISEYYIYLKEPQIAPSTCSTWKKWQESESNLSLTVRRRKWRHIANQRKTLIRIRSRDNYELYSLEPYEQKVSAEQKLPAADIKSRGKNNTVLTAVSMLRDTCWEKGSVAIHDLWSRDLQWSNFLPMALLGPTASSEMNLYVHLNVR